jgi:hypothetical protein
MRSLRTRLRRWALGPALLVTALASVALRRPAESFTPFVPEAPPQRAVGDVDGDGRMDTAFIQDDLGERGLWLRESGSADAVRMDDSVTSVIEGDIDHDGDLDIVAATPSGDLVIWLNDGHGRFTRQAPSQTPSVSSAPAVAQTVWTEPVVVVVRSPFVLAAALPATVITVVRIPSPLRCCDDDRRSPMLPPVRAPPPFLIQI